MSASLVAAPLARESLHAVPADRPQLLGGQWLGHAPAADGLPLQRIAVPLLGGGEQPRGEAWRGSAPCRHGGDGGLRYRCDGQVLFGVIELAEEAFPPRPDASPLQQATEDAYRRLYAVLDGEGYRHLWRVWNYLADINGDGADGLERYREFNIGREDAFLAAGRLAAGQAPAACALGVAGGPLSIAFLAGRDAPILLENPRQVSAYRYPADYGPRSPTFSRAALARLPEQEWLFISGTASIVGHRTVHPGDIVGQTRESLANIAAVLGEANRHTAGRPYALRDLACRVYVRHGTDYAAVRDTFRAVAGADCTAVFVQADVCRADLLVEIEGQACQALD